MNHSKENTETIELKDLKAQRKQQKLSVQALSDGMKVSKDFVRYIESEKFEKLGAATFVRGHITNYCKVLGIEPALILAQVPVQFLQHQELHKPDAMAGSPLSHVRIQSSNLGRYVVGTALLGMLSMSFYFIWDKWSLPSEDIANQSLVISQEKTDQGEKKIVYSSLMPQVAGPDVKNKVVEMDSNGAVANDSATPEDSAAEATDGSVESNSTADGEVNQLDGLSAPVAAKPGSHESASVYTIVMQFEEQAWVSIKTLDGDNVVQDLLGPGLREFQVTKPVHFRIGNAQKLQLSINDNSVELAPLTVKDIADFQWPMEPNS